MCHLTLGTSSQGVRGSVSWRWQVEVAAGQPGTVATNFLLAEQQHCWTSDLGSHIDLTIAIL